MVMGVPQSQETAEENTGIQSFLIHCNSQVFRKAAGNWDIQNIQFPFASEAKGIILISMNESGVRNRESH